jgi:hypothetical protein
MRRWLFVAFVVAVLTFPGKANADPIFNITIGSLDLNPGGSGTIDVMISSAVTNPIDGSLVAQNLANAGYAFAISASSSGNGSTLEFETTQDQSYESDGNYVFPHSGNVSFGNTNGVITSSTLGINDIFSNGGDNNLLDPLDPSQGLANVLVSTPVLLIRLQVTAANGSLPQPGDQFFVTLQPPSDVALNNTTFFQSVADNNSGTGEPYISSPGLVTIHAVPEPGSFALLGIGSLASGWLIRRRAVRNHSA